MSTGKRRERIVIERVGEPVDDGFTTHPGAFEFAAERWAEIIYGTGQERREASRESASLPATFRLLAEAATRAITPGDHRLRLKGETATWDITSAVPAKRFGEIEITATRSVS